MDYNILGIQKHAEMTYAEFKTYAVVDEICIITNSSTVLNAINTTLSGDGSKVTVNLDIISSFSVGDEVIIRNTVNYNGTFTISLKISSTSFEYSDVTNTGLESGTTNIPNPLLDNALMLALQSGEEKVIGYNNTNSGGGGGSIGVDGVVQASDGFSTFRETGIVDLTDTTFSKNVILTGSQLVANSLTNFDVTSTNVDILTGTGTDNKLVMDSSAWTLGSSVTYVSSESNNLNLNATSDIISWQSAIFKSTVQLDGMLNTTPLQLIGLDSSNMITDATSLLSLQSVTDQGNTTTNMINITGGQVLPSGTIPTSLKLADTTQMSVGNNDGTGSFYLTNDTSLSLTTGVMLSITDNSIQLQSSVGKVQTDSSSVKLTSLSGSDKFELVPSSNKIKTTLDGTLVYEQTKTQGIFTTPVSGSDPVAASDFVTKSYLQNNADKKYSLIHYTNQGAINLTYEIFSAENAFTTHGGYFTGSGNLLFNLRSFDVLFTNMSIGVANTRLDIIFEYVSPGTTWSVAAGTLLHKEEYTLPLSAASNNYVLQSPLISVAIPSNKVIFAYLQFISGAYSGTDAHMQVAIEEQ